MTAHLTTQDAYHRLRLWNIGLTLVDAVRVSADVVLDDLADTEAVLAAVDRLAVPTRS